MDPRGMTGRMYKEDHYALIHGKYECSVPCGFEEDFFSTGRVWTPGARLAGLKGNLKT